MDQLKLLYIITPRMKFGLLLILILLNVATAAEMKSNEAIEILSDTLVLDQEKKLATFVGNVKAIQGDLNLAADKMIAYYINTKDNKWVISKISAIGNVTIIDNNQKARGDTGEYNAIKETLELYGSVILTKDDNVLKGNKLVYNIQTGYSKIYSTNTDSKDDKGRVKAILIPKKQ
ncbi:lipopolysaccharide transport periplasmic protein LptA [Rickettsiales bacterium Ac37b]|nr:lipopolysaccharide transport periplasmic protein LptA [Rickettsiales bacterium Ac37b]